MQKARDQVCIIKVYVYKANACVKTRKKKEQLPKYLKIVYWHTYESPLESAMAHV